MKIIGVKSFTARNKADFIILPFIETKKGPVVLVNIKKFSSKIKGPILSKDFSGKQSQSVVVYLEKEKETKLLLLGLGTADKMTPHSIKQAYADAINYAKSKKAKKINLLLPQECNISDEDLIFSISEALLLANYSFNKLRSSLKDLPSQIETVSIIGIEKKDQKIIKKAEAIISGVNLTRDLVNNNADEETPQNLAKVAKAFEKISSKVKVTIFNKSQIAKEKMGLLLAVNKGSDKEPRFIIVKYHNDPSSKDHTVLVGKGVTYDTGGLSLKPSTAMDTMKSDMSGAATVLGVIYSAAKLNLKVNLTVLVPSTENSIGPSSYKPGDVYVGRNKKTVEVVNTDAEGRLILADALAYGVSELKPTRVIDVASLTGAIVIALGEGIAGLFTNNDKLSNQLLDSSKRTEEHIWRIPLHQEYKKLLKSEIADIKNCGSRNASSITAALFLEEFVNKVPWAHLDIAGVAYFEQLKGLYPTHASGIGVRLLVDFLKNL